MKLPGRLRPTVDEETRPPYVAVPRWGEVGVHGIHRPREWDEVRMVEADGPVEPEVELVVLPDGSVAGGDPDEAELVAQLELEPPYRARAVQRGLRLWAVATRRIAVTTLAHPGQEIELARRGGQVELKVDGVASSDRLPELEALLPAEGVVRASRIGGDVWETRVDRL
jgi:hypothetical protein